jgi:hypothetical protein
LVVEGLSTEAIGENAHREGVVLHELSLHEGSLEEMFMAWTGDASSATPPKSGKKEVVS